MGPEPFTPIGSTDDASRNGDSDEDRYAEIAARYGVTFEDDDEDDDED